ncbi:MAG: hypothetical protein JSV26_10805 [bacterium]|nr:MAG: hypothetical protein JSV26_10805 [bacterium]
MRSGPPASVLFLSVACALVALILVRPDVGGAMPPFAKATGQACSHCHISPFGGGPLTPSGEAFREALQSATPPVDPLLLVTPGQRILHAAAYLIHILFGVGWVGIFLYLFLPAALRHRDFPSPPRGYLRQMWYGAAVVIVAGPFLAYMKVLFIPGLLTSRFGLLLVLKILAVLCLLATTVFITWYIVPYAGRRYRQLSKEIDGGRPVELTTGDLSLFTGRGKRKALAAADGVIYDLTGRNLWRHGIHPGGHHAGQDLSDSFRDAPHGPDVLERVPRAGRLLGGRGEKSNVTRWYYRAIYLGTAACLVILAVVALWRL